MTGLDFQRFVKPLLERSYSQVVIEWPAYKDARDSFARNAIQYYPRTDIAVGPFSIDRGQNVELTTERIKPTLRAKLLTLGSQNPNPRCLLAIEVVFSGSSKHILGDILNASALGLYGIIVVAPSLKLKVVRNIEYLKKLRELSKVSPELFQNVLVVDTEEFKRLIR